MQQHYITLRYTHHTKLDYTTLHTLHCTTLRYTTLHYTKLHKLRLQLQPPPCFFTLHHSPLHYIAPHYPHPLHYTIYTHYTTTNTPATALHYSTKPQLQLHYTTTTAALHHTTSRVAGDWPGDHCNHCNHSRKDNSNHLSDHQWIRSAIRDSPQPSLPLGSYRFPIFENFRYRLLRYDWYYLWRITVPQQLCSHHAAHLPSAGPLATPTRRGRNLQ